MPRLLVHMLLAAIGVAALPAAAMAETVHDEQGWTNLTIQGPVSGRLVYFAEAQPRFSDGVSRLDQLILRPAIGWRLNANATVYQGYARVVSRPVGQPSLKEDRSFQQLSWIVARPWGGEFSTRTRLEQRWRSDGDSVGWRAREMARFEIPVRGGAKLAALGYAEAFFALNDTDWGAKAGFDQLRSFIGAEMGVGGGSTVELGYLNQLINQSMGRTRMNHVLSVALFVRH